MQPSELLTQTISIIVTFGGESGLIALTLENVIVRKFCFNGPSATRVYVITRVLHHYVCCYLYMRHVISCYKYVPREL